MDMKSDEKCTDDSVILYYHVKKEQKIDALKYFNL